MSRFFDESSTVMADFMSLPLDQRMSTAQALVRDRWLAAGELRAIVVATLDNWTSGNCIEFMAPISQALIHAQEWELLRHLWARSVKRQAATLFREYGHIRSRKLTVQQLLATNTSKFDETNARHYANHVTATAFFLQTLLATLDQWQQALRQAGQEDTEIESIRASVMALKSPRIEISRLSAKPAG